MRIRLSQRGWNNVLIFTSMFLIILFNYSSNMFSADFVTNEPATLVEQDELIQAIDFSGIELQRVGSSWRVLSRIATANVEQPAAFVEQWQLQPLEQLDSEPVILQSAERLPVVVWLVGQSEGLIFEFFIDHNEQTVYVNNKATGQWFVMSYPMLFEYIPRDIINA